MSTFSVQAVTFTPVKGKASVWEWDPHIEDWMFERLLKPQELVTVAGPPGAVDRPWWWGLTETGQ